MTNTSERNKDRRLWLLAAASLLIGRPQLSAAEGSEITMTAIQLTLWEAIEALSHQTPPTREKIESVLQKTLDERANPSNDVYRFFVGDHLKLKDGVVISKIDFRIHSKSAGPWLLNLSIEGACVELSEVRSHYKTLEITATPRGRSLHDATAYTSMQPWGELSFGFKERDPSCLAYIALRQRTN